MTKNKDWLKEITDIICPKCGENYLIRDKHKHVRGRKVRLESLNKDVWFDKIKKRDNLECVNCGIIKKYKGEKTKGFTEGNYREYLIDNSNLRAKKERREMKKRRKEKHLIRLHTLKSLKKTCPYNLLEKLLGKEYMIKSIMESMNRIGYTIRVISLSIGYDKSKLNPELLNFLINKMREINDKKSK